MLITLLQEFGICPTVLWLESGLGQTGQVPLWRKMLFPLEWQVFTMHVCSLLVQERESRLQQEWLPHSGLLKVLLC